MSGARRALHRRAAREAQQAGLNPRQQAIAVELATLPPGKVMAADLPVWSRPVIDTLRDVIANARIIKPCEKVLRGHRGVPSTLKIEWMFSGMLAANWDGFTFSRKEILKTLSKLPDPEFGELAPRKKDGDFYTPRLTVFNNQQMRLEKALRDGSIDLGWLEKAFIKASIPDHIAILILLVAIDTTAFPGWHLTQRYEHEADIRRTLRKRYREIHGEIRRIPEMDTPEMRAFAEEELGIIIGEDGRMLRCDADPDLRGGYKTPTPKRPQELYSGYASHAAVAAHLPTADDGDDAHMPTYITAVTTTAANADSGPIGELLALRTLDIAINAIHNVQDMAFSRMLDTYTIPLREAGQQIHMNFPAPATKSADGPLVIKRRDKTEVTLAVSCGVPFHEHTPKDLLALPADLFEEGKEKELATRLELRHHWCWDVIEYDPKTGQIRVRCPFCAGKLFDPRLPASPRLRANALPVQLPASVTECCPGTCTVTVKDLPTFQTPVYGTPEHTKIMNQRNAVESPFGIARDRGGLEPGTCKAARLEAHALAALMTFTVMNLQTTMDQEIKEVQDLLKRHRQQQAIHTQAADAPADGVEPAEAVEPVDGIEPAEAVQPDGIEPAEAVEPVDGVEPAEAVQPDGVEPAEAVQPDGIEPAEAVQLDGIELAEAVQPDEAAPTHEERASDPQELPQAVTLNPNDGGGSAATIHKRARPPP